MLMSRASVIRLPILMLIGGQDPVIDPKANREFYDRLGLQDKTLLLYPKMLHEPLNELGREQVYDDVSRWLEPRIRARGESVASTHGWLLTAGTRMWGRSSVLACWLRAARSLSIKAWNSSRSFPSWPLNCPAASRMPCSRRPVALENRAIQPAQVRVKLSSPLHRQDVVGHLGSGIVQPGFQGVELADHAQGGLGERPGLHDVLQQGVASLELAPDRSQAFDRGREPVEIVADREGEPNLLPQFRRRGHDPAGRAGPRSAHSRTGRPRSASPCTCRERPGGRFRGCRCRSSRP